jgi:ribonucleoside-diphosphate reductase alpha chain
MKVFDAATEAIKQGGTRRGANMAILDVHHPDIEAFINVKADMTTLTNFNISVAVDEAFMRAVEADEVYDLINPRTGEVVAKKQARAVFDQIVANAWQNGDPGLVFLDRINADNPTPQLGAIEATNPCGEQPLLPYESCNLGSINLAKFKNQAPASKQQIDGNEAAGFNPQADAPALEGRGLNLAGQASASDSPSLKSERRMGGEVDWHALAETISTAVRFLDNVIDMNLYPVEAIDRMTKQTRKIGLGLMGWADLLYQLRIPYDSEAALALADQLMGFVREHADAASEALAAERGSFPAWEQSIYGPSALAGKMKQSRTNSPNKSSRNDLVGQGSALDSPSLKSERGMGGEAVHPLRNSTRTTVAPTGTLSIIAGCSGGIEPAFALAFQRQHFLDPKRPAAPVQLREVNPVFEQAARDGGFYSDALMDYLAAGGSLSARDDIPDDIKRVFVTAHDIAPEWHVRMQAAFQRHTDNAVSKTINFPRTASIADVAEAYLLAFREGCKGITIYRDGSRMGQVLSHVADGEGILDPARPEALEGRGFGDALHRRHLPDERQSITHKFRVGEQEGYVTVGLFEDGTPGEIFVTIAKEGSTIRGLMDSVAMLTSYSLQYGVALRTLVDKFRGVHFEPAGFTSNPDIPQASSLVDYIFRWLELRFLADGQTSRRAEDALSARPEALEGRGPGGSEALSLRPPIQRPNGRSRATRSRSGTRASPYLPPRPALPFSEVATGLLCPDCGSQLIFSEGCLVCRSCGFTRCG